MSSGENEQIQTSETAGAHSDAPLFCLPATPFHSPAYLSAYRRHFGNGKRFIRLRCEGDGDSAAAWLQARGRSARRLEWWGAGIHDIGSPIYDSPDGAALLWQRLHELTSDFDGVSLAQIPAGCQFIGLAQSSGWNVQDAEACPVLDLPPTWEEYLKVLGKNMREQIKRYPKRLEKEFTVEYSLADTPEEVDAAMSDLFRLHGQRWRARGQTGVLATPRRQKFHRQIATEFLRKDWLRLWSLRCNGETVCVLLNYFYRSRYYFFIGGFAPEWSRWSVGTCLFSKVFQRAIDEGATEFDFLRGEEEYKYRFGAQNRHYKTISWYAPTARGRLLERRVALEEHLMHEVHKRFSAAHRK